MPSKVLLKKNIQTMSNVNLQGHKLPLAKVDCED